MQIEIKTEGKGRGTQIYIDGDRVLRATQLSLTISATGSATLQIDRHVVDENGKLVLTGSGDDRHILQERYLYSGTVSLNGDLTEKLVADEFERHGVTRQLEKLTIAIDRLTKLPNSDDQR